MTFATHNYPAARMANPAKRLSIARKGLLAPVLTPSAADCPLQTGQEGPENHWTWAASTTAVVAGSAPTGSAEGAFTPTRPGNKKSSGETLLDALMPPQPLSSNISAKDTAPITTFRFRFKGAL